MREDDSRLPSGDKLSAARRDKQQQSEPDMTPQQLRFANGQHAQLLMPPADAGAEQIISALRLEQPEVVFLILGGANDQDEDFLAQPPAPAQTTPAAKNSQSGRRKRPLPLDVLAENASAEAPQADIITRRAYLTQLFSRGIARTAVNVKAAVVGGGPQATIMALMGQGVADRGRRTPLIGVVPASKVTYPGGPQEGAKGAEPLDPNHTHFVLTGGEQWGDETEMMYRLAATLAKEKPVITILVNGGSIAKTQLLHSVRCNWPVIVIKRSGHLADEISELWQYRPSFIPDPGLAEIIEDGQLHFLPIEDAISGFGQLVDQLLYQHEAHVSQVELVEMAPRQVQFPNKKQARLVISEPDTDPGKILRVLELKQPEAVLVLLGGSAELNEAIARLSLGTLGKYLGKYGNGEIKAVKPGKSGQQVNQMSQALMDNIYNLLIDADEDGSVPTVHKISMESLAYMVQLFRLGVGPAAAEAGAVVIDGGRKTGVMAMMGQATLHQGHALTLVGVAPAKKVTYPGGPADGSLRGGEPLDPHHTHFVLTEGSSWGDETEVMYELAAALAGGEAEEDEEVQAEKSPAAKDKLVATVLVNGDSLAKEQLVYSVQRGWPIIVVKGSGGLANEIARLWETKPAFIPDPDLAEITTNGKLHVLELKNSAANFRPLLGQLLNYQRLRHHQSDITTIEQAWKIFGTYDAAANRQQRDFRRIQFWILLLGVLATFLVLTKETLEGFSNLPAYYTSIDHTLYYTVLVIPIVITALAAAANEFSAGKKWILLRASAESIKKEIYRYRAKAEVYSDQETKNLSREQKLQQRVNAISANLMNGEAKLAAIKDYEGPLPPPGGGAHPEDDGISLLTPDRYLPLRLADQYNFYKNRTIRLEKKLQRLQWLIYLIGGAGTLLVAVGLELWIALTTALVTAFTTYLEYQQVENTLIRYNKTATDLNRIMVWWEALSVEEQADPRNVDKLVGRTEAAIHSEHAAWVHEMQDVIDELTAQQAQQEESRPREDRGRRMSSTEAVDILKLFEGEEFPEDREAAAASKGDKEQPDDTETSSYEEAEVTVTAKGSTTREKK